MEAFLAFSRYQTPRRIFYCRLSKVNLSFNGEVLNLSIFFKHYFHTQNKGSRGLIGETKPLDTPVNHEI